MTTRSSRRGDRSLTPAGNRKRGEPTRKAPPEHATKSMSGPHSETNQRLIRSRHYEVPHPVAATPRPERPKRDRYLGTNACPKCGAVALPQHSHVHVDGCMAYEGEHVHRHCVPCRRDWSGPTMRDAAEYVRRIEVAARNNLDGRTGRALSGHARGRAVHFIQPSKRYVGGDPTARTAIHYADGTAGSHDAADSLFPTMRDAFEKAAAAKRVDQDLIPTAKAERDLMPLLLFNGSKSMGEIQGMWNFSRVLKTVGVRSLNEAVIVARESQRVRHLCGLHRPGIGVQGGGLVSFARRLLSAPKVMALDPDLPDYLRELVPHTSLFTLNPIARWSPWSNQAWRRPHRGDGIVVPEVWPFASDGLAGVDGFDLVLLVDAAVPKTLPEVVRQEVCQDLLLAVLDGTIAAQDLVGSAGEFTAAVFRRYPIKYGPLSLDAPAPWAGAGDARTLLETLTASNALVLA